MGGGSWQAEPLLAQPRALPPSLGPPDPPAPPTGIYSCPCYYYPNRAGTSGRPSFVIGIDLRSGASPADHWIKRGTALLMSLDT